MQEQNGGMSPLCPLLPDHNTCISAYVCKRSGHACPILSSHDILVDRTEPWIYAYINTITHVPRICIQHARIITRGHQNMQGRCHAYACSSIQGKRVEMEVSGYVLACVSWYMLAFMSYIHWENTKKIEYIHKFM